MSVILDDESPGSTSDVCVEPMIAHLLNLLFQLLYLYAIIYQIVTIVSPCVAPETVIVAIIAILATTTFG